VNFAEFSFRFHKKGEDVSNSTDKIPSRAAQAAYWKSTLRLTISLLMIWFLVSFGAGILFRETLDEFSLGGAPLGFWFAQNGAIYTFLLLIVIYCIRMTQLEKKYGIKG
jgi:putative solute:sodium symporter small subunit